MQLNIYFTIPGSLSSCPFYVFTTCPCSPPGVVPLDSFWQVLCLRKNLFEPFVKIAFASLSRDLPSLIPRLTACCSFPSEHQPGSFIVVDELQQAGCNCQVQGSYMHKALRPFGSNLLLAPGKILMRKWVIGWTQGAPDWRAEESFVWSNTILASLLMVGRLKNLSYSFRDIPCLWLW